MKAAICDNDIDFIREFRQQVGNLQGITEVYTCSDPMCLAETVREGIDLIFMDMDWDEKYSGIDLAEMLCREDPARKIVFVTAYIDRFVQQVYLKKMNVAGFLAKPVDPDLLAQLVEVITSEWHAAQTEYFLIRENGRSIRLKLREILYLESRNHLIEVHTTEKTYKVYQPLSSLIRILPTGMVRCHRSYLVNLDHIQEMGRTELTLTDDVRVPVGRFYQASVKQQFVERVAERL